jgi:superfamily I DNA/RNA helicase
MTLLVLEKDWLPVGVDELEPSAWEVVKSSSNKSVIAGPGAGKTELLAQRACFLLQTNKCAYPRRILAISFKRDSANTLKERVLTRCGYELAARFDSLTFDAFAKSLLDRFYGALPDSWRPANYIITFPRVPEIEAFLDELVHRDLKSWAGARSAKPRADMFMNNYVVGSPLSDMQVTHTDFWKLGAEKWWRQSLRGVDNNSRLTFPMIGRLAELLLRVNPKIRAALQATYSHVFMDEFQDTTGTQYSLVTTTFCDSLTIITAVGDKKQQIMRWAGALDDSFERFESDFNAVRHPLVSNYRSSVELVNIQHTLARAIDPSYVPAKSKVSSKISTEPCVIYEYDTPEQEAKHIAGLVMESIHGRKLIPRDFAFLVRQRPQDYESSLSNALRAVGIKVRNEADLQDLLAERLTQILIPFLRLGIFERAGEPWQKCLDIIRYVRGLDFESSTDKIARNLSQFHNRLRSQLAIWPASEAEVTRIVGSIINFLNVNNIRTVYREYDQGNYLQELVGSLVHYIEVSCKQSAGWSQAVDDFEGIDSIPILTIHKSKGLEYDTVMFIGLDDQAWWSFPSQPEESKSAFFVAFSRAKQRVIFTYCKTRGGQKNISSLYDLLQSAGVQSIKIS